MKAEVLTDWAIKTDAEAPLKCEDAGASVGVCETAGACALACFKILPLGRNHLRKIYSSYNGQRKIARKGQGKVFCSGFVQGHKVSSPTKEKTIIVLNSKRTNRDF